MRDWLQHPMTREYLRFHEERATEYWTSFQQGLFLKNEVEHAKAVQALEIYGETAHAASDEMIMRMFPDEFPIDLTGLDADE